MLPSQPDEGDFASNTGEDAGDSNECISAVPPKPSRLSVHSVIRRNLEADADSWSQEAIAQALGELTHIRLDRENIGEIDGLEVLGQGVRCLYLQHNHIRKIENLDWLPNLHFLALQHNSIKCVENLRGLNQLGFLDLSYNLIDVYDVEEFPTSLVILNLSGNTCTSRENHRSNLTVALPKLRQLDGVELSADGLSDDELTDDGAGEGCEPDTQTTDHVSSAAVEGIFASQSAAIVARSHSRLEELEREHELHVRELETIRGRLGIYPDDERPDSGRWEQRDKSRSGAAQQQS